MERRLGSWLPFFLFPFPLGSSSLRGYWKRSWNETSRRVVPLSAWGVALLSHWWWRAMDAESWRHVRSSGRLLCSFQNSSLPLFRSPVAFMTFRVCLLRALRQVLEAMLAEGALESPSVLVLAFQSSFPSGEVVWWVGVWWSFPLTWTDVSRSLCSWWWQSLLLCLSQRVGFSSSSGPDGVLLSGPVAPFLEETFVVFVRCCTTLLENVQVY